MRETRAETRIGGHVVAESLRELGAEVVFGLPGVHVLPIWEGLRATELPVLGFRQELNAGFAADGHARVTGRPSALVVSTGPGAFMTLAPLMEAFSAFVPVVVIASQIDAEAIGKGRGHLHETPDQTASFAPLVKWTGRANSTAEIRACSPRPGGGRRRHRKDLSTSRSPSTCCTHRRTTHPSSSWTEAQGLVQLRLPRSSIVPQRC